VPRKDKYKISNDVIIGMGEIINDVKKSSYLDDILKALSNVRTEYMVYYSPDLNKGNKSYYKYTERMFAYELYHQYRIIMQRKKKKYAGLYLNGEQQKSSQGWKGLKKITPDIVLHGMIDKPDYSGFSQKWLCEIKMFTNPEIVKDLTKIKNKASILRFQDYFFIFVGGNDNDLKIECRNKHIKVNDVFNDTICICIDIIDSKNNDFNIICKRISNIIDRD
jgi:hypothetical protein